MRRILAALAFIFFATVCFSQQAQDPGTAALVCAYNTSPPTISTGKFLYVQCDTNGKLLTSGGGGATYTFSTGLTNTANTITLGDAGLTYTTGVLSTTTSIGTVAGLVTAPSVIVGNATTGLYSVSTTGLGLAVNGTEVFDYGITNAGFLSTTATEIFMGGQTGANAYTVLTSSGNGSINGTNGSLMRVNGSAKVTANATGAAITGVLTISSVVQTGGFAIASLPAGTLGMRSYVTDQLTACVAAGAALVAGGSVKCPVFYNGTAWVGD